MPTRLTKPLWPNARLNLTTSLHLILCAFCVVGGTLLYLGGYTYEGSSLAYMMGGVIFAYPYYNARYTPWMTFLVMAFILPQTIWLQNKAVETQIWLYPADKRYLAWITQAGEGPWRWTQILWLGNDMPVFEYFFYPLFCFFQMTLYCLYSHVLPDEWFEQENKHLRRAFYLVFFPVFFLFIAFYFVFPNHKVIDYSYWIIGIGNFVTIIGYFISPNFRRYSHSPAFWLWIFLMGVLFMPVWEIFHSCINRDWVYNIPHTFPPLYTIRGASITVVEPFGYLMTATTFQAIFLFYIRNLGKVVIRDYSLVPFSKG